MGVQITKMKMKFQNYFKEIDLVIRGLGEWVIFLFFSSFHNFLSKINGNPCQLLHLPKILSNSKIFVCFTQFFFLHFCQYYYSV